MKPIRSMMTVLAILAIVTTACSETPNDVLVEGSAAGASPTAQLGGAVQTEDGLEPAIGPVIFNQPETANRGRWKRTEISFESDAQGPEAILPEVREIVRLGATYWAYGSDENGAGAIWKSDNLDRFTKVFTTQDLSCCRLTRFTSIAEFDGAIVAGGTIRRPDPEDFRETIEHSMLVYSRTNGATWVEVDDPAFSTAFHRLDALHVAAGTLVASVYLDECCTGLEQRQVRTTDLETWESIVINGATDSPGVFGIGTAFLAAEYPQFAVGEGRLWESADAITWAELPPPLPNSPQFMHVAGSLMQAPRRGSSNDTTAFDGSQMSVLVDGAWAEIAADVGQFGDFAPSFRPTVVDPASGATYAIINRSVRQNPHYCYEDVATCSQSEAEIAVTRDGGFTWNDLPGALSASQQARGSLVLDPLDNPAYWEQRTGSERYPVTITRWTGSRRPSQTNPAGYPPPDTSVPFLGRNETLQVGETARFVWSWGSGCSRDDSIIVNEVEWEAIAPISQNIWPHQEMDVSHGANKSAYGHLTRTTMNRIEFSIRGLGVVAELQPAPLVEPDPNQEGC